jgi:hypothetical protein
MANNYLLFSETIDEITPAERDWIKEVLIVDAAAPTTLKEAGIRLNAIDIECWPGFQWELPEDDTGLLIYSDESGHIEHVAEFVRAFLACFRRNACWSMTWAATCSKPRAGEFYGGGIFVTAQTVKSFCAIDALEHMKARFEQSRLRSVR